MCLQAHAEMCLTKACRTQGKGAIGMMLATIGGTTTTSRQQIIHRRMPISSTCRRTADGKRVFHVVNIRTAVKTTNRKRLRNFTLAMSVAWVDSFIYIAFF